MVRKAGLRFAVVCSLSCTLLAGWMLATATFAQDEEQPEAKYTIKEIMQGINKGDKLAAKVAAGEASEEEKKKLLDFCISMLENEPPKGDMASWQKLSGNLALAAAKVVVGREGAEAELKAANNCRNCHTAHKP